jgi:hypothetical protein
LKYVAFLQVKIKRGEVAGDDACLVPVDVFVELFFVQLNEFAESFFADLDTVIEAKDNSIDRRGFLWSRLCRMAPRQAGRR